MHVKVLPYTPLWSQQFAKLKSSLEKSLREVEYISIEHVGSTSVPGLAAKPIIDIDVVIAPAHLQSAIAALTTDGVEGGGYDYKGEWGVPDRHAFRKYSDPIEHNLYVCIEGSQALRNHLLIRDLCLTDAKVRDMYGSMKLELAKREWESVDEYCDAKSELLGWMLAKAGMSKDDIGEIRAASDYEAIKLQLTQNKA